MNRRGFFQSAFVAAGALTLFSLVAKSEERRRGGGGTPTVAKPEMVDPKSPAAAGVSYVANIKDIKDAKLKTERSGVQFKDQQCKACVFYVKDKEAAVGGKKAAPCQMPFAAGKFVAAEGWCSSWAKK